MAITRQQYFDLLVKTSTDGKFPAVVGSGCEKQCAYRTSDGKRCAAGLLIPDEEYNHNIEGMALDDCTFFNSAWLPEGMEFEEVRVCQTIHDTMAFSIEGWNHDKFVGTLKEKVFRDF